jgi:hypothetical protein
MGWSKGKDHPPLDPDIGAVVVDMNWAGSIAEQQGAIRGALLPSEAVMCIAGDSNGHVVVVTDQRLLTFGRNGLRACLLPTQFGKVLVMPMSQVNFEIWVEEPGVGAPIALKIKMIGSQSAHVLATAIATLSA